MSKFVKGLVVAELKKRIGDNKDFLVIDPSKVDAVKVNQLRLKAQKQGIRILTVKNALAKVVLAENGVTALDTVLEGPSALVWGGEDIVALSKELFKWMKEAKALVVKGGTVDGASLNAKAVEELSKSAGKPELLGRILNLIRSPGGNIAGALLGPGGVLAGQIKTLAEKTEEDGAAEGSEAPAAI